MYKPRTYRSWVRQDGLVNFEVKEKETDLFISANKDLSDKARAAIVTYRSMLENYIKGDPSFYSSLEPIEVKPGAPEIVKKMCTASLKAGVGPMAAVAGAVAEFVGRDLLEFSDEIIVENGGDIFVRSEEERIIGVFAGDDSPFTGKLSIRLSSSPQGVGVCTSSGTVSHSLSFGNADAALIISDDAALADAAATATGNIVKSKRDIEKGIEAARSIQGVDGVLIIVGDKMGTWGNIKLVKAGIKGG